MVWCSESFALHITPPDHFQPSEMESYPLQQVLRRCGSDVVLSDGAPAPGMHLLCILPLNRLPRLASSAPRASYAVAAFAHSLRAGTRVVTRTGAGAGELAATGTFTRRDGAGSQATTPVNPSVNLSITPTIVFLVPRGVSGASLTPEVLVALTLAELERPRRLPPHQPAALFTLAGRRLVCLYVYLNLHIAFALPVDHALLWLWSG